MILLNGSLLICIVINLVENKLLNDNFKFVKFFNCFKVINILEFFCFNVLILLNFILNFWWDFKIYWCILFKVVFNFFVLIGSKVKLSFFLILWICLSNFVVGFVFLKVVELCIVFKIFWLFIGWNLEKLMNFFKILLIIFLFVVKLINFIFVIIRIFKILLWFWFYFLVYCILYFLLSELNYLFLNLIKLYNLRRLLMDVYYNILVYL